MNLRAVPSGEGSRGGFDPRTVHDAGRHDPRREALFTYRCYEGDGSADVALRDRTRQVVTILRVMRSPEVDEAAIGGPMFRVRFADGFEGDAWNDEITPGGALRREASFSPGGTISPSNLFTPSAILGYDPGMRTTEQWAAEDTCPWCGEADPGEQSGITTCCAEAVIGPAEAQLTKGAK